MSNRAIQRQRVLCCTCDATYDPSDPQQAAVHEHPEPQSGPFRSAWLQSGLPYLGWLGTEEGKQWEKYTSKPGSTSTSPPSIHPTIILPGDGCRARLTLLNAHSIEVVGEVRVEDEWRAIRSFCVSRQIWEAAGRLFEAEPTLILQDNAGEVS